MGTLSPITFYSMGKPTFVVAYTILVTICASVIVVLTLSMVGEVDLTNDKECFGILMGAGVSKTDAGAICFNEV